MKKIIFSGALWLLNVAAVMAVTVSGTITDARTGNPLAGVQLGTLDKQISAMTDETGKFEIELPATVGILSVNMPGYALREIAVQGRTQLEVSLYPKFFTSAYGQKGASDFSLSTATSPENDIQTRLGSEVRTITRSGVPGIGGSMFIGGLNSLTANGQPLILVDGVIWDNQLENTSVHNGFFANPLSNIDVRDIENITVLREGTSIYGSRAANGVILITTKRGVDMATRITANIYWGANTKPRTPKMMNATQYREYVGNQVNGWINQYSPAYSPNEEDILNRFPFLNDDRGRVDYWRYHNDTDWSDVIYSDALTQNYSLNVNGGDEVALYNLSVGYLSAEGSLTGTDMNRFNVRFNSDVRLAENIFSKIDVSVARATREVRDQGIDQISSPEYIALIKAPFLAPYRNNPTTGLPTPTLDEYDIIENVTGKAISNPLALINRAEGSNTLLSFRMKFNPYWQITKDLRVSTIYSYGLNSVKESFFIPSLGIAPRLKPDGGIAINEVRDMTQHQTSVLSDTWADWKKDLTDDQHLTVLGGFRYTSDDFKSDMPRGYNTGNDNIKVLTDGIQSKEVSGDDDQWKSLSWYGNVGYDYLSKYFLTLTAAADASSRFGSESGVRAFGANWGLFPSLSAGWLVTAEDFMKKAPEIDYLKLRAGYGLTGNDDISSIASRSYLSSVRYIGKAVGIELANIQNKQIQWETTAKANFGIDLRFLDERLGVSLDVFNSKTDNLLTLKDLEAFTGKTSYWSNEGQLTNSGYELALNARLLNLRSLKWELSAGLGHYKNKITALPDNKSTYFETLNGRVLTQVGQPAGVFYGYKSLGVFMSEAEAQATHSGTGLAIELPNGDRSYYTAGDIHFDDKNDDGIIDSKDWQVIGDPNPDYYGAVSNRFQWKHVTLDVLFTYSYGNDIYNALRAKLEAGDSFHNQTAALVNRWQSDQQALTAIPKAVYGDPQGNSAFSDRWIEDGSYLRLKTLTVAYDIPFDSPYLQGITVWASANNLWTATKYLGSDPEFSMNNKVLYQGIDAGLSPQGKSYYLGVKINL